MKRNVNEGVVCMYLVLALQYILKSLKTSTGLFNLLGHTVPEETIHDSAVRTMVVSQK